MPQTGPQRQTTHWRIEGIGGKDRLPPLFASPHSSVPAPANHHHAPTGECRQTNPSPFLQAAPCPPISHPYSPVPIRLSSPPPNRQHAPTGECGQANSAPSPQVNPPSRVSPPHSPVPVRLSPPPRAAVLPGIDRQWESGCPATTRVEATWSGWFSVQDCVRLRREWGRRGRSRARRGQVAQAKQGERVPARVELRAGVPPEWQRQPWLKPTAWE